MTPKEKAKELYDKYQFIYIQNYTSSHEVIQCALIAINEIEETGLLSERKCGYLPIDSGHKEFWEMVRIELKSLI